MKKLGLSLELSYTNIRKYLLCYLNCSTQSLLLHLTDVLGMSRWTDKFGALGLSEDAVQSGRQFYNEYNYCLLYHVRTFQNVSIIWGLLLSRHKNFFCKLMLVYAYYADPPPPPTLTVQSIDHYKVLRHSLSGSTQVSCFNYI